MQIRFRVLIIALSLLAMQKVFAQQNDVRLRGMMVPTFIDETGVRDLAQLGANHIRWQLTWGGFPHSAADNASPKEYREWLEKALTHVDKMLPLCNELGIKVLIDLHTLPGGTLPGNGHRLFVDKTWQDEYISIWKEIAARYNGNTTVWGYDIANEPHDEKLENGVADWPRLASVVSHEIRAIDKGHVIVVEAQGGDIEPLGKFQPIDVPGLVYSFHMYVPHSFTHQNVYGKRRKVVYYPGYVGLKWWDKEALTKVLDRIKEWQLKYNTQIYVGEFSAIRWAPDEDAYNYLRDCIDLFEINGWSWCYHAFREWHGWSMEHDNVRENEQPAPNITMRKQLFIDAFIKNKR